MPHIPRRRLLRRCALVSIVVLTVGLSLSAGGASAQPQTGSGAASYVGATAAAPKLSSPDPGVMANLWEWNWRSVAKECTDVLGPAGYGGVQVAPPQDSVKRTKLGDGDTILHPWWEVYQPVDYYLTSRMGSEAEFKAMVKTCRQAGVKVYVDAVINHMTGQGDTSYGGRTFQRYAYRDLGVNRNASYANSDFHKYSGDCPSASGGIEDFNNLAQVRYCELVGLSDLRTDTSTVRKTLAAYLNKLIGYGVSGFRVDAAKHIGQDDLDAIDRRLHNTVDGTRPLWALEVFGGAPGILSPEAFTSSGQVLGLDAVKQIRDAFKSYPKEHVGSIATLKVFGAGSGLTPSDETVSFVQNHDTERNGDALNYKDGARNVLATQWLLASGYGTPQVYAAFTFTTNDDSPPATADGMITDTDCSNGWSCTDRDPAVIGMVGWHNYVGKAKRQHWWDDGQNVIAFGRGSKGWVAVNNGPEAKKITVATGLPAGTYCDVLHGTRSGGRCTGPTVRVRPNGTATVTVGATAAVAIRTDRRI
ncbi:MAG TPA: alpha-amylase family glycosyl hydrolase [Microlunatus sp.]|nr:alpha-amylase family glycosyl hydrolase [Microlunatus sp.]